MTNETPGEGPSEPTMGRFRERVAAGIALLVIVAALGMIVWSFRYLDDKEKFGRAKDLLLIINPVLGLVIGYYFNKVSTEARAENAEKTARTATADARQATESRDKAQDLADAARTGAQEMGTHLEEVSAAAEKVLAQTPDRPAGVLAAGDTAKGGADARRELENALARARRARAAPWISAPAMPG
ncbi:MAG: hypothetical protein LC796_00625 [Acidobacteria bacterium]|nr:hypothetical protein [Acidobacteriota bacterium]MCA1612470.1 hypothetical protein [Acidobacteriota bacterium]